MPAHTQTWRAEDKHTDRQTSADNTESFLLCQTLSCFTAGPRIYTGLPVPDTVLLHSRARIYTGLPAPDTVLLHSRAPDFHWTSCTRHLPASQQGPGFTLDFLHQTPPASQQGPGFTLDFLCQTPSCFTAGPGFTLDSSCPAWDNAGTHTKMESQRQTHGQLRTQSWFFRPPEFSWALVLLSILPFCPGSVLLPRSRDAGQAPKCCARCLNPRVGREKASKTMQLAKRGRLLLTRARALCCIQHSGAGQRAPSPSCYTNL